MAVRHIRDVFPLRNLLVIVNVHNTEWKNIKRISVVGSSNISLIGLMIHQRTTNMTLN